MKKLIAAIRVVCLVVTASWMLWGIYDFLAWGVSRLIHYAGQEQEMGFSIWALPFAFMEYPEKELIALCIVSAAAVFSVDSSSSKRFPKFAGIITFSLAFLVGIFALFSKVTVSFFSADRDIAQWHHLCVAVGILLLSLVFYRISDGINDPHR